MISRAGPEPAGAGRLPVLHRVHAGHERTGRPVHGPGLRVSRLREDDRQPARGQGPHVEGLHGGHGQLAHRAKTCRHPEINARDNTQSAKEGDQYAARHNPFVYFHSIIDTPSCAANDVPLDRLPDDLASKSKTANYNFITPNLCNDGHDAPCVDDAPGGLVSANTFLRQWVPRILDSPAYKDSGLLIVTFDEAEAEGEHGDASACCGEQPGPNTPERRRADPGAGRRPHRRGADLALHRAGHEERHAVQPLLAAEEHRGHLRAAVSRLRGPGRAEGLRRRRLQPQEGVGLHHHPRGLWARAPAQPDRLGAGARRAPPLRADGARGHAHREGGRQDAAARARQGVPHQAREAAGGRPQSASCGGDKARQRDPPRVLTASGLGSPACASR